MSNAADEALHRNAVHHDVPDGARYRVYAIKYADRRARRPEHFIGGDPHDQAMDMDYFVWAIVADPDDRDIVADPDDRDIVADPDDRASSPTPTTGTPSGRNRHRVRSGWSTPVSTGSTPNGGIGILSVRSTTR